MVKKVLNNKCSFQPKLLITPPQAQGITPKKFASINPTYSVNKLIKIKEAHKAISLVLSIIKPMAINISRVGNVQTINGVNILGKGCPLISP